MTESLSKILNKLSEEQKISVEVTFKMLTSNYQIPYDHAHMIIDLARNEKLNLDDQGFSFKDYRDNKDSFWWFKTLTDDKTPLSRKELLSALEDRVSFPLWVMDSLRLRKIAKFGHGSSLSSNKDLQKAIGPLMSTKIPEEDLLTFDDLVMAGEDIFTDPYSDASMSPALETILSSYDETFNDTGFEEGFFSNVKADISPFHSSEVEWDSELSPELADLVEMRNVFSGQTLWDRFLERAIHEIEDLDAILSFSRDAPMIADHTATTRAVLCSLFDTDKRPTKTSDNGSSSSSSGLEDEYMDKLRDILTKQRVSRLKVEDEKLRSIISKSDYSSQANLFSSVFKFPGKRVKKHKAMKGNGLNSFPSLSLQPDIIINQDEFAIPTKVEDISVSNLNAVLNRLEYLRSQITEPKPPSSHVMKEIKEYEEMLKEMLTDI